MLHTFWPEINFTGGIMAANIAFAAASFAQKVPVPNYFFKIVPNTRTISTFFAKYRYRQYFQSVDCPPLGTSQKTFNQSVFPRNTEPLLEAMLARRCMYGVSHRSMTGFPMISRWVSVWLYFASALVQFDLQFSPALNIGTSAATLMMYNTAKFTFA